MTDGDNQLSPAWAEILALPLPTGWARTTVGELGEVRLGRQRSPKNRSSNNPTKYVRAANITWAGLDLSDVLDMEFRPEEMPAYRLQPGDVLLSEASGSADEVGKPAVWNGEIDNCCFQNTVIRFRPHSISSKFAHLAFLHYARNGVFSRVSKGVGIQHLSADRFSALPLLLPPAAEQDRIVAKAEELFSELDAGAAALKRVRTNLKRCRLAVLKAAVEGRLTEAWRADTSLPDSGTQLLEGILNERRERWEKEQRAAFAAAGKSPPENWRGKYKEPAPPNTTNLPALPKNWCWTSVDQLVCRSEYGTSVKCAYDAGGVPVLRIPNIASGQLTFDDIKFACVDLQLDNGEELLPGDVLICRTNGSLPLLGKAAIVQHKLERPHSLASYLLRFRFVDCRSLPLWFHTVVSSTYGRRFIESHAASSAGQHNISLSLIHKMPIPLPPLVEQMVINQKVEVALSSLLTLEEDAERGLSRAARLKKSLLKVACEGGLVAQDATDQAAHVLLARIKQQRVALPPTGGVTSKRVKPPSEVLLVRASIVSYTVRRLSAHRSFGRTQLEKTVYLTQSHLGLDLGFVFERYAAGPFDKDIYRLEAIAKKKGWFSAHQPARGKVDYRPGGKIDEMCRHAIAYLGDRKPDFDRLLDQMEGMSTDEAELFATAYAAWNDLLIDGRACDEQTIIAEVHAWHEKKIKFSPESIRRRLQWMRQNGYVPRGQGQRTGSSPENAAQRAATNAK